MIWCDTLHPINGSLNNLSGVFNLCLVNEGPTIRTTNQIKIGRYDDRDGTPNLISDQCGCSLLTMDHTPHLISKW